MKIVQRKRPYTILTGDVREMLATLPDESVHCCVTSPPYWGLRDYGTKPGVWGGDSECEHEWGEEIRAPWANAVPGPSSNIPKNTIAGHWKPKNTGPSCHKCGAWRGQLGLEPTPELYVEHMVEVFREVRRVLRKDGTFWLNMGDCYAAGRMNEKTGPNSSVGAVAQRSSGLPPRRNAPSGLKQKDLVGIPWCLAFALQADGWYLRSDIIWAKKNCMPESCTDRPTKSHEYIFLLTKSAKYFFDQEAVRQHAADSSLARIAQSTFDEQTGGLKDYAQTGVNPNRSARKALENFAKNPGANIRSVWTIPTQPFPAAHFAVFPEALPERCIKAGTSERGCCPGCGAPWVRVVERTRSPRDYNSPVRRGHADGWQPGCGNIGLRPDHKSVSLTIGWKPFCSCAPADPVPCTVLDPFIGSGTTALVAVRLGRRAIGIDLNTKYTEMVEKQLAVAVLGGSRRPRKFRIKGRRKLKRRKT